MQQSTLTWYTLQEKKPNVGMVLVRFPRNVVMPAHFDGLDFKILNVVCTDKVEVWASLEDFTFV